MEGAYQMLNDPFPLPKRENRRRTAAEIERLNGDVVKGISIFYQFPFDEKRGDVRVNQRFVKWNGIKVAVVAFSRAKRDVNIEGEGLHALGFHVI